MRCYLLLFVFARREDEIAVKEYLSDSIKGPRANYLMTLRTKIHRKQLCVLISIDVPMRIDLRRHRGGKPCVENVSFADKSSWLTSGEKEKKKDDFVFFLFIEEVKLPL